MRNMAIPPMSFTRDPDLEGRLADLLTQAAEGRIPLDALYQTAEGIKRGMLMEDPKGFDDQSSYALLKLVIGYLHDLHDKGTIRYYQEHPDELLQYARLLKGEEPWKATFDLGYGVTVEMTYQVKA